MTAVLTPTQTREIADRVEKGERLSVVGIDFGLLDTEVRQIVDRARSARIQASQPRPAPSISAPSADRPASSPGQARGDLVPGMLVPQSYLAHPNAKIAKAAAAAHKALGTLCDLVKDYDKAEANRQRAEKARADAEAEVAKLERQLADAKSRLKGARRPTSSSAKSASSEGPPAAVVRRWAAEQGIDVPSVGRVPTRVREAFEAARVGQEASA